MTLRVDGSVIRNYLWLITMLSIVLCLFALHLSENEVSVFGQAVTSSGNTAAVLQHNLHLKVQALRKSQSSGVAKPAVLDWKAVLNKQRKGKQTNTPVKVSALEGMQYSQCTPRGDTCTIV